MDVFQAPLAHLPGQHGGLDEMKDGPERVAGASLLQLDRVEKPAQITDRRAQELGNLGL